MTRRRSQFRNDALPFQPAGPAEARSAAWCSGGPGEGGVRIVVGVSDMKVTAGPADMIVTFSLGSCIGLALYDPVVGVGGMMHTMMPIASRYREQAERNPCKFTDTGVAALLDSLFEAGAMRRNLIATIAGGAAMLDTSGVFNIGHQNYVVVRKMLWRNDILITAEAIGGLSPRTMRLYMENGTTTIATGGTETILSSGK